MIVIDPSKGGSDAGISSNGIVEKEFNLLISKYIYDRLKQLNADVKIIRTTDEFINNENRAKKILDSYGNNSKVVAISNQLSNDEDGVEIIYPLRNNSTLAKSIADNLEDAGLNVSKYYQKRRESDTAKDFYDIQNLTGNIQTIIIDYGNINDVDAANNLKNNYQKYAEAVVKALANYQGIPYYIDSSNNQTYIVQKGDSLYLISNKFNTTVDELKTVNNLSSNLISIGQKLVIPTKENSNNQTYIVQKGDSLYLISNKFNVTVDELKKSNNLSSNLISIGQKLVIPTKENSNNQTYIVQKGDSLYLISNKFNVAVDELKKANNLSSNLLSIGQILKIPTNKNNNVYIVKSGDNLYSIASKYNTTVNELKTLNNLNSNLLSIGQELKIPN